MTSEAMARPSPVGGGNILDRIVEDTRRRNAFERTIRPLPMVIESCRSLPRRTGFPFEHALGSEDMSFICEAKRASPSKGLISPDYPYIDIARGYESVGASAVSVLTEPLHFRGSDRHLEDISRAVSIPILRKDFVIDEIRYQPWEKGYMAEVIYTTNDGASSNVVFVQQPAGLKVTSGDETSGESGKASYSCMPNESETCSGGRLAISTEGDLSCVCDKGQTEGCSLHEIKY